MVRQESWQGGCGGAKPLTLWLGSEKEEEKEDRGSTIPSKDHSDLETSH